MGLEKLLIDTDQGLFGYTEDNVPQQPNGKKFEQRSFGYGPYQPFTNPSSPLIVTGLPGVEQETNGITGLVNQATDNFVRGGVVAAGTRAFTDLERLGKFFLTPNGLRWVATNFALHKTNPRTIISPKNRNFSGIGSAASAITSFAGIRFRKDGLLDLNFEGGYNYEPKRGGKKYEYTLRTLAKNNADDTSDHALLGVYTNLKLGQDPSEIKKYGGGAHSVAGIGRTVIKRYKSNPYGGFYKKGSEYVPIFDDKGGEYKPLDYIGEQPNDFREVKKLSDDGKKNLPFTKKNRRRQPRYKTGNPGLNIGGTIASENGINHGKYNTDTVDQLNASNIYTRSNLENNKIFKDYIKFKIAVVNVENPLEDKMILFRAFLDDIGDNFKGEWNSFKYNGRAEKFYTYNGFDRSISFSFKIHAQTRWEMKPLWRKLNYLAAQTAPEYKNRRMRGVFSRLTIGDWMNELPGFFTSINLSWNTSYPWEIRSDDTGVDSDMNEYPHILDVNCNFTPIHNFTPANDPCVPFILPEIGVEEERRWAKAIGDENLLTEDYNCFFAPNEETAEFKKESEPAVETINEIIPIEDDEPGFFSQISTDAGEVSIDGSFLEEINVEPEPLDLEEEQELSRVFQEFYRNQGVEEGI